MRLFFCLYTYLYKMGNTKIKWEDANFKWDKAPTKQIELGIAPYTWDDVTLLEDLLAQGDDISWAVEQLDPDKKKRFIKLVCKVKGIETYSGQKTINDDIYFTKFDCCETCYIKYVDGREQRWLEGWRPKNVTKSS